MPQPGRRWYHIIVNTRNSWRHGDERGFRSRGHRLHSSGDYQHRPPKHEHAGLRRYHEMRSGTPIRIPRDLFEPIARTMLDRIARKRFRVLAASIDHEHVHLLVELPDDRRTVKRLVGGWKQAASHAVRERMPGKIWSDGSDPVPIRNQSHQRRVFGYILEHAERGAWVWSYRKEPKQDGGRHRA